MFMIMITLRKAHVVISTRCGEFCGDLHHRSKSPHVLLAVLTTSPNHHKSLSRFSPHVKIATCICGDLAQGLVHGFLPALLQYETLYNNNNII